MGWHGVHLLIWVRSWMTRARASMRQVFPRLMISRLAGGAGPAMEKLSGSFGQLVATSPRTAGSSWISPSVAA